MNTVYHLCSVNRRYILSSSCTSIFVEYSLREEWKRICTYGRKLCSHIHVLNYCLYKVVMFFFLLIHLCLLFFKIDSVLIKWMEFFLVCSWKMVRLLGLIWYAFNLMSLALLAYTYEHSSARCPGLNQTVNKNELLLEVKYCNLF